MKKTASKEDDYFGRLPDDIIIDIFERVNNCNFLTQCLLLSKRIASLICFVSSIKISIPSLIKYHIDQLVNYNRIIKLRPSNDLVFKSWWKFGMDNNFFVRESLEVLHPFSEVKSAIVEYPAIFDLFSFQDPKTTRWMVEYSGGDIDTGIIKSCAFLGPIVTILGSQSRHIMMIITWIVSDLFMCAFSFFPMVAQMAHDHESLRDILITSTDPRKGWIHAGGDEIVKLRQVDGVSSNIDKLMKRVRVDGMRIRTKVKVWYNAGIPDPPGESNSVYAFVVVSSSDNIDHQVKVATSRLLGDCKHDDNDERINMRKLVETMPCNLEFTWIANYRAESTL